MNTLKKLQKNARRTRKTSRINGWGWSKIRTNRK